ncbi:MAG: hypothetical protein ABSC94_22425 [Polyangiaceae bacterium]
MTVSAYRSVPSTFAGDRPGGAVAIPDDPKDKALLEAARRIVIHRVGLASGGVAGVGCAFALLGVAVCSAVEFGSHRQPCVVATVALLSAWGVACVALVIGRWVAAMRTRQLGPRARRDRPGPACASRGDATRGALLGRLEDDKLHACALAMRWERASVGWPLAALSLLAPLTIHWLAYSAFVAPALDFSAFGLWIVVSAVLVGHAHVALACCCMAWATALRVQETTTIGSDVHARWASALAVTCAVASIPGAALLAIPPVLTCATGFLFVPAMFVLTARRVVRERLALGVV